MIHEQVYVKVNARVDKGISDLITTLSAFPFIETTESCQGIPGEGEEARSAFVFFVAGNWQTMAKFVFGLLGPRLAEQIGPIVVLSASTNGQGDPLVEMRMPAESVNMVASVINDLKTQSSVHSWEYSCGKSGTLP
jgi:hypothetical protein